MQACQRTCYATGGCVAFQYSLDETRHYVDISYAYYNLPHSFCNIYSEQRLQVIGITHIGEEDQRKLSDWTPQVPIR